MTQWHGAYTWAEAIKLAKKLAVKSGESATIHEQGYDLVAFVTPEGRVDDGGYGDQYRSKRADQPLGKKAWIDSNNLNAGSIANNLRHLANDLQDVADLPTYDEVRPIVKALRLQMAHLDIVLGNLATSRR